MGFPALTQANINKIQIDEGYLVLDYGLTTELPLGPIRGGGEFAVKTKLRDIEFDGRKGKSKGMQVVEEIEASLKVSTLVCSQDILALALPDSNYPASEMVTNGSFTGGSTGWTLNTGWTYSANAVSHSSGTGVMSQTLSVVQGRTYRLIFDLTRTAGDLTVTLTNATGTSGALIASATGVAVTFKATATGSAVLTFTPSTDFAGTVDNVSVKCLTIYSGDIGLVPTSKYRTNMYMFAKCLDGTYKKIAIFNPFHEGDFSLKAKSKSENEHSLEFFAHFDPTAATTTVIYQIDEIAAFPEA